MTDSDIVPTEENTDKAYFIMSESFRGRYLAEPERYSEKIAVYEAIAGKYPVVYQLSPNGSRRASKWLLPNIVYCLQYMTQRVTCGGSTITVYALQ